MIELKSKSQQCVIISRVSKDIDSKNFIVKKTTTHRGTEKIKERNDIGSR